jgi:chromosomal replication initiator protein
VPVQAEEIWDAVRQDLRRELPDFKWHTWVAPLELAAIEGRTLYVRAPEHCRTWVSERHLAEIREAARRAFDERALVEVVGPDWTPDQGQAAPEPAQPVTDLRLNPRYTFEQFVIGAGNRFAHAAALAVAEMPGQAYNPLLIHGRPGLGKTHLLHAIGNYVARYGSGLRVRYATVEEFTNEFLHALQERRTGDFKGRFRGADVVLIDDVQFLARKDRTREEFFHTFNALHESGRQVVLTSDRRPEELVELEERLSERFRSGLVVPLEAPERSVRRAIVDKRARLDGVELAPEVVDEIALRVTSSVRALQGALIQVVAYASFQDEPASVETVRQVVGKLGGAQRTNVRCTLEEVIDAAAAEFGVRPEDLIARDRRPSVANARQVAMFVARELTGQSLPEIGRGFGGRNHSTVLHAIRKVGDDLDRDPATVETVDKLRGELT